MGVRLASNSAIIYIELEVIFEGEDSQWMN